MGSRNHNVSQEGILELYNDRKQLLFLSFLSYICYLIEGLIPKDKLIRLNLYM